MLLGDAIFWAFGLFAVGVIGFFIMAATMIFSALGSLLRMFVGDRGAGGRAARNRAANCTHTTCGHVNPPGARFCGRCGAPIRSDQNWDSYG